MSSVSEYNFLEERVVLLNDRFEEIGSLAKEDAHTGDTPLHLAFSLFLFDSSGRLLVQRRALSKKTWAGVWSNSCCGHPMPGELMVEAVYRRTRYELGLELGSVACILPDFRYRAKWNGIWENEHCPVWVGFIDETPSSFCPEEVEEVDWVSWEDFSKASISEGSGEFSHYSPWSLMEARELAESASFNRLFSGWVSGEEVKPCVSNVILEGIEDAV